MLEADDFILRLVARRPGLELTSNGVFWFCSNKLEPCRMLLQKHEQLNVNIKGNVSVLLWIPNSIFMLQLLQLFD